MIIVTLVALVVADATHADDRVTRFTLDNGLRVILRPVDDASRTAIVTLFDVGEAHDPVGQSGLAHLIEHLYVTCAAGKYPASTAEAWFARYGSQVNAQTGLNYTVVATVVGSETLEAELEEAAARMHGLTIVPADLERELPRLERELTNMYGGIPHLAAHNLAATAVLPLPPQSRKGGVIEQLRTVAIDDLAARHAALYKPGNAILSIVGGFEVEPLREMVSRLYGGLLAGSRPLATPGGESEPHLSEHVVDRPAFGDPPEGIATIAFKAPLPRERGYAAFLVTIGRAIDRLLPELRQRPPVPPFSFLPVDLPEVVFFSSEVAREMTADEAIRDLRRAVIDHVTLETGEVPVPARSIEVFGAYLGFIDYSDLTVARHPYGLAFGLGRRGQLAIDPEALERELLAVTAEEVERCVREVFGPQKGRDIVIRISEERVTPD